MTSEHDPTEEREPKEMLKAEIQDFLDRNIYPGFRLPFRLQELRVNDLTRQIRDTSSYVVIFKGIQEEDLPVIDREWTAKLWEIGQRWEMELRLPYWYFEK